MSTNNKPIVRLEKKMKSLTQIRESVRYTRRGIVAEPIDPAKKVGRLYGSDDPYRDVRAMLSSVENIRSNAVYAIEIVMTASPSYFRADVLDWGGFEEPKLRAFVKLATEWSKSYFNDNLISMTLHLDQATPHIHTLVVPLLDGKLNCRELYGRKARLKQLQVSYADALAPLGLERGTPEKGVKHTVCGKWIYETKADLDRRAVEVSEREKALEDERVILTALDKKLATIRSKQIKIRDMLRARDVAVIEKENELDRKEKVLRANAQALSYDAKHIRQLIFDLENLQIDVPEKLAKEGEDIVKKIEFYL